MNKMNTEYKILKTIKKRKKKYLIIDLSKSKRFKKESKSYSVSIGQFGKINISFNHSHPNLFGYFWINFFAL